MSIHRVSHRWVSGHFSCRGACTLWKKTRSIPLKLEKPKWKLTYKTEQKSRVKTAGDKVICDCRVRTNFWSQFSRLFPDFFSKTINFCRLNVIKYVINRDLEKRQNQGFLMICYKRTVSTEQCGHTKVLEILIAWLIEEKKYHSRSTSCSFCFKLSLYFPAFFQVWKIAMTFTRIQDFVRTPWEAIYIKLPSFPIELTSVSNRKSQENKEKNTSG